MNICQVTAAYYPYPSGVSENVYHLSKALRARGHDVQILTTNYGRDPAGEPAHQESGVTRFGRAWFVPLNRSFATVPIGWRMSGQVKRFLRANRFDVLHLHGIFPPDISFWALKHSQTVNVVTFHTVGFATSRVAAWLCRRVFGRYNRKLALRIAETRAGLEFVQPYFPGEYRIIPAGVDTDRFNPALRWAGPPPAPGFEARARRILFVGRLDARKGLPILLKALPAVRARIPDVELIVVGRGPMEQKCRQLTAKLGLANSVSFQGHVSNELLPRYYVSADVYCAPTLGGEAFGIVLLEAMASGTPVVASDITGYNEVVKGGETGLLCPPGDPAVLAGTLIAVLTDAGLRIRLRANGRAWAERHSWSRGAAEIESHYYGLLPSG